MPEQQIPLADLSTLTDLQKQEVQRLINNTREAATSEAARDTTTRKQYYLALAKEIIVENKRVLPADQRQITTEEIINFANVLANSNIS